MANNIFEGQNIKHATQTVPIGSTGINTSNVLIIYSVEPNVNRSFVPGRSINGFTSFTQGQGYIIIALQAMDLSEYLAPPFNTGGNGILLEDGGEIIVE